MQNSHLATVRWFFCVYFSIINTLIYIKFLLALGVLHSFCTDMQSILVYPFG